MFSSYVNFINFIVTYSYVHNFLHQWFSLKQFFMILGVPYFAGKFENIKYF